MKFIRFLTLLFTITCSVYAVENKQIFAGKIMKNGVLTPAFLLEILSEDMANRLAISENGDVYIKVDQLVNIPSTELANFMTTGNLQNFSVSQVLARDDEPDIQCGNCRYWYNPRSCNGRKCPRCGTTN